MDKERIKKAVVDILEAVGENPNRPGLKETPDRVVRMYEEILAGINGDISEHMSKIHHLEHDEMVIVKDIPFYSLCEHHMVPFFGRCHIAYIPQHNRIIGLSKLARAVDLFSKRLQLQERLTIDIVDSLMEYLDPKGAAVVIEARHMCMEMRGIKKPGAETITSAVRGVFRTDNKTREEFLTLIK